MALNSPGVEVQVNDNSFYVPAEPGTKPLIIVASKEGKTNGSGTGIAVGTLKANAGKPYLLSSTRDLAEIFGTPYFQTDSNNNPVHGSELNEYGLQAAYSYLGVSNSAWVVRADVDLSQLSPSYTAPNSTPNPGQYWLDTRDTHFGIFEWNGLSPSVAGGQKFTNKVPVVITDSTQVDPDNAPLGSMGKVGDYAVVSVTSTNTIYYRTSNTVTPWVKLGSPEWSSSLPAVQGTKTISGNGILVANESMIISTDLSGSTYTVTVPSSPYDNLNGFVDEINLYNSGAGIPGVTAANVNGRLEVYGDDTVGRIRLQKGTGSLVDTTVAASKLGIVSGYYGTPKLSIQSHTNVPLYKRADNAGLIGGIPTGSVWIKTTNVNLGAHWIVKVWNQDINDWSLVEAPVYDTNQAAIYGLDRAGGGKNIAKNTVFVQANIDEDSNKLGTFSLFRRELPKPTSLTSEIIVDDTFINGITYGLTLSESVAGSLDLSDPISVEFVADSTNNDATLLANAINSAGFDNISATVNARKQVVIVHEIGGEIRLRGNLAVNQISGSHHNSSTATYTSVSSAADGTCHGTGAKFTVVKYDVGTSYAGTTRLTLDPENPGSGYQVGDHLKILGSALGGTNGTHDLHFRFVDSVDKLGYTAYDVNDSSGTANFYTAPAGDMTFDYVVSNWKPLKIKASDNALSETPSDGTLWYNPSLTADIMIHNGTKWVGYLDGTSVYSGTDPNGPLLSATKPTAQSDGTDLANGDLWIDTSDMDNYPAIYKWDDYNKKWIPVDNSDNTTEDGIVFADARYNTEGANSDEPGDIADLLLSDFVDFDSPDPELYPRGILLFNTRRSGNNIKRFVRDYIDTDATNIRMNDESQLGYYVNRWVNESGNAANGAGLFGRRAQRKVVVKKLKALVDTNQLLREQEIRTFNLIACPGYTELIANMINLNFDRKQTAFVIGDSPMRLPSDSTSLNDWGKNVNQVTDNGDDGLFSHDEYLGVYYPSGYATDNTGNAIVVPASHMVLRSIALSDGVSFPWFAPAGTRRGKVLNATSIGYIDSATNEWQAISLNQGQRDTLYSVGVNPITYLTGAGIVIFGQKTRASDASSLDRINVARLVVYLRGQLSALAKPYIFEPNDKITRDELKSAAESIMLELVGQRGIYDYLVVCDETNNSPSQIDRSELHLDIAIEPTKSVEFIYIPLRLQNTGEIQGLGK